MTAKKRRSKREEVAWLEGWRAAHELFKSAEQTAAMCADPGKYDREQAAYNKRRDAYERSAKPTGRNRTKPIAEALILEVYAAKLRECNGNHKLARHATINMVADTYRDRDRHETIGVDRRTAQPWVDAALAHRQ